MKCWGLNLGPFIQKDNSLAELLGLMRFTKVPGSLSYQHMSKPRYLAHRRNLEVTNVEQNCVRTE